MKKIFVLLAALGAMTAVFAQRDYNHRDESRDIILGQPGRIIYDNDYSYRNNGYYERTSITDRINREYNWKIESVRDDRFLRRWEKRRQIRFLEAERDARIREVMRNYDRDYRVYERKY